MISTLFVSLSSGAQTMTFITADSTQKVVSKSVADSLRNTTLSFMTRAEAINSIAAMQSRLSADSSAIMQRPTFTQAAGLYAPLPVAALIASMWDSATVKGYIQAHPGPSGVQGSQGAKGDKGDPGTPGSNATVTASSITSALGYTPPNPATLAATYQPVGSYLTAETDGSTTNELQTLSGSGNTVTLSQGGGSYTIPTPNSAAIVAGLGYTPYNASNPAGYITASNAYSAAYGLLKGGTEPAASFRVDTSLIATTASAANATASLNASIATRVPTARALTINGVTQDLSADRTWTVTGPVLLGSVSITQTATVAISAGKRQVTVSAPGTLVGDRLLITPTTTLPSGYDITTATCAVAGTIIVTVDAPLLAIGATYSISCKLTAFR